MNDINSQANRGGSSFGTQKKEKVELTHEQFEHEREKREAIEKHQHRDEVEHEL